MARILIVSCNFAAEPSPVYPIGAATVATALRTAGHEAFLFDPLARGETLAHAVEFAAEWKPNLVGLSIRNIDNTSSVGFRRYLTVNAELVAQLRSRTGAPVVLGGAGFSLFPEALLRLTSADYGIVGEGEAALLQLVSDLEAGRSPATSLLRTEPPMAAETIGCAAREPELAAFYLREGGMLNVQSKRGCPFGCVYCSYPLLEGPRYRLRPPAAVADEIERQVRDHQANYFAFVDSVFNDPQGHYLQVAEELARRALPIQWMATMRPARFTPAEAALLRRAGLDCIEWGTDGACDASLRGLGKSFLWDEVVHSSETFQREGVRGAHFIIFGGPGETNETVAEGLANLNGLRDNVVIACLGVRVLPGTAMHRRALAEGVVASDDDLLTARFYFSPAIDAEQVDRQIRASFDGQVNRIYPPNAGAAMVPLFHQSGHRGPIWDLLLRKRAPRLRRGGQA